MTAFFLFLLGLVVGSFLNVVAFRYSPEGALFHPAKWGGRSHCLFCSQPLKWYELIPVVSFIIQEGRCLVCRKQLSWQYPLVELASGLTFLLPVYFSYLNPLPSTLYPVPYTLSAIWVLIFLGFILIWAIDARLSVIPDEVNLFLGILGLGLVDVTSASWSSHLIGALAGALLLGLIVFWSRGRAMGLGDVKLAAALGLIFGWPNIFLILALAFIFGAIVGTYLIVFRKKGMKDAIPFGPFLILGSLAVFFFGQQIMQSYLNLFGV
jgi:prepilin signal peptidase PulO-like enzyme (type II secretory pathway)